MVLKLLSDLGVDMKRMTEAQVEGFIKNTQNMTQINDSADRADL